MKQKPVVGQKIYSLNVGNDARGREQKLTKWIVKKVGRIYFTCGLPDYKYSDKQFYIKNWRQKTDYCSTSILYSNKNEFEQEKRISEICNLINKSFEYGRNCLDIDLESLEKIENIIKAYK